MRELHKVDGVPTFSLFLTHNCRLLFLCALELRAGLLHSGDFMSDCLSLPGWGVCCKTEVGSGTGGCAYGVLFLFTGHLFLVGFAGL